MHRSRLAGIIVDCQTDDLDAAAKFWSQALGYDTGSLEENYVHLETKADEPYIEVQKVEHQSRVHIDIESDDVEAEVSRLEKLGAKRIKQIKTWWVMEAPTGHRFCVVCSQSSNFADEANEWSE